MKLRIEIPVQTRWWLYFVPPFFFGVALLLALHESVDADILYMLLLFCLNQNLYFFLLSRPTAFLISFNPSVPPLTEKNGRHIHYHCQHRPPLSIPNRKWWAKEKERKKKVGKAK
jgi:hypothetical protein